MSQVETALLLVALLFWLIIALLRLWIWMRERKHAPESFGPPNPT